MEMVLTERYLVATYGDIVTLLMRKLGVLDIAKRIADLSHSFRWKYGGWVRIPRPIQTPDWRVWSSPWRTYVTTDVQSDIGMGSVQVYRPGFFVPLFKFWVDGYIPWYRYSPEAFQARVQPPWPPLPLP